MQERAGGCCAGAVLQGREGGGQKEGAGHLMEKPGSKAVFQSRLWPRRQAGGISKLRCPGQASPHHPSSDVASQPGTDSSSTCHQTTTGNAATRCKCH